MNAMIPNASKLIAIAAASIRTRRNNAEQEQNDNAIRFWDNMEKRYTSDNFRNAVAVVLERKSVDYATLKSTFTMLSTTDKKAGDGFLANYAFEKVAKLIRYGAGGEFSLDRYTSAIVANALLEQNGGKLSATGALRSLVKFVESDDAIANESELVRYCTRVKSSTGSTQRSSTREALRVLGLASVNKRANDDAIVLTENGRAFFGHLVGA